MSSFKNFNLIIKVDNICNMRCDYCYYLRKRSNIKEDKMSFETVSQMIRSILTYNTGYTKFIWHGGEPLLFGLKMFEYAVKEQERLNYKKLTIDNSLQTNGLLLDDEWVKFFAKYNFCVGVSLDGTYDLCKHRNVSRSDFDKILKGIQLLNESHIRGGVLTVVTSESLNCVEDMLEFYLENGIKKVKFLPCIVTDSFGNIDKSLSIKPKEYGLFLSKFLDAWLECGITDIVFENFDNYIKGKYKLSGRFCSSKNGCGESITVSPNGDLYLCDSFYMTDSSILGNVKTDFFGISDTPNFRNFMKKVKTLPKKCVSCKFLDCCGGDCPHERWIVDRDFTSPSYLCEGKKLFFQHFDDILESNKICV